MRAILPDSRCRPSAASAAERRSLHVARLASAFGALLTAAILTGCSSSGDSAGFPIFADPGKYQYYNCAQLAEQIKSWTAKQRDLKLLMDRAEQSPGGAAVGFIAYKADYVAAGEELDQLHYSARSKKCAQDETWRSNTAIR